MWPNRLLTPDRFLADLRSYSVREPPISVKRITQILDIFKAYAIVMESDLSFRQAREHVYVLSDVYLKATEAEEVEVKARLAARGTLEPRPFIWSDAANVHRLARERNPEPVLAMTQPRRRPLVGFPRTRVKTFPRIKIARRHFGLDNKPEASTCPECNEPVPFGAALVAHIRLFQVAKLVSQFGFVHWLTLLLSPYLLHRY